MRLGPILLLAPLVASCAGTPANPVDQSSLTALIQTTCLAPEMRRDAFEALAREQKWERLLRVVREGDQSRRGKWETTYRAGAATVNMSGVTTGRDPNRATYCAVMTAIPATDWREEVGELARSLALQPTTAARDEDVLEVGAWSETGEPPASLVYERYNRSIVVSIREPDAPQP